MKNKLFLISLMFFFAFQSCEQSTSTTSQTGETDTTSKIEQTQDVKQQLLDAKSFADFYKALIPAVKANDTATIADFIQFPTTTIKSRAFFVTHYDSIFNPIVKDSLYAANLDSLFVNYQGAMIGNGQIWINQFDSVPHFRIIGINY